MVAQNDKSIRPRDFFATHPVFTHAEFVAAHTAGGRSPHTSNSLLTRQVATGRLLRVKRGVYATVPVGVQTGPVSVTNSAGTGSSGGLVFVLEVVPTVSGVVPASGVARNAANEPTNG